MGAGTSSNATTEIPSCYNCGCALSEPRTTTTTTTTNHCIRCHASLMFHQHPSTLKFSRLRDVLKNGHDQSTIQAPNLEHVWIGTFEESLVGCDEEKEMTCEYLINTYLKPYFAGHPNELVYSGVHWFINKIHFKVYSCYPPIGKINSETKYHLEDENNGQQLLKLHSHLIRRVHILPTLESYNRFKKSRDEANNNNNNNNANNNDNDNDNNDNNNGMRNNSSTGTSGGGHNHDHQHTEKSWNEELFNSHIKSFFKAHDIFRNGTNNNVEAGEHTVQSTKMAIRRITERTTPSHRHLIAGEVFVSKGIQFRVMSCEPNDGLVPLIGLESIVHVHGNPLQDVSHLSLQIVYDALSNDQKQISPEQFRTQYLDPYFKGRVRYINRTQELNIFGIKAISTCEPTDGIVTEMTKFDNIQQPSSPANTLPGQEESDWEMAQRLQQEEEEQRPRVVIGGAEHFHRFLAGLAHSPDRHIEEHQLALALVQLLQQLQHHPAEQQGLPIGAVERLPLYEYKPTSKDQEQSGTTSDEDRTCRICLVDFENGSKVRWMPCFHRYHRECIDRWLEMNRKCPICKTDVLQTLRQDRND